MYPKLVISFPHMGNYAVIITQLLQNLFPDAEVKPPPPITQHTVALGNQYSPDFVCAPFKYNLGNYIEALEQGANVLLQTGTGCRYGYYGELQEQILRDLGYEFTFACFSREHARPGYILQQLRTLGCKKSLPQIIRLFGIALRSIHLIDQYEYWMRENIGFECCSGQMEQVLKQALDELVSVQSMRKLHCISKDLQHSMSTAKIQHTDKYLRVGLVGELYTLMEPFSNFNLEKQLANQGIQVSRVMNVWFLLFGKSNACSLKQCCGYLNHCVGANGVDSVSQSLRYAREQYDGIIHLKSFGCVPELNVMNALMNLSREQDIPILHLSFDSQTSETGVQTRLEAFADMIRMRKERVT